MARSMPDKIEPDTYLSSHEVGGMLQCNPSSVNKWVKEGKLIAHRTPGGHRRMRAADVVVFLAKYLMPIPPSLQGVHAKELSAAVEAFRQVPKLSGPGSTDAAFMFAPPAAKARPKKTNKKLAKKGAKR